MNLLEHKAGRSFLVFAFYFAEGAPIGFIWWAMPTVLRQHGIEVDTIASFTALLTLPWIFKFLWAPLIDMFRSPQFGFLKWIAWSQLLMCLTLVPLVFIPISGNLMWWGFFLLLHSLAAATQDVSVDALVINIIAEHEKGVLNGYMQAGMLLSRSIFGGAALIFIPTIGLSLTVSLMIACILVIMLLLLFIKEPLITIVSENTFQNFKNNFKQTFSRKQTWFTIAFALTAAAAFEAAGAMSGSFFTDKQIDSKSIGFFFSIPIVIAMLLGGLLGGFLSDKMSRKKSVTIFLVGLVFSIVCISVTNLFRTYPY
jgi:PAT family beta-lactamase induction signal transducer AmpG